MRKNEVAVVEKKEKPQKAHQWKRIRVRCSGFR